MTAPTPIYSDRAPNGLVARLFHCFPLTDGTGRWVCYPRQEEPMPEQPDAYAALCAEFHQEVMVYLEQVLRQEARQRHMQALWAQIKALEAAQQAGDAEPRAQVQIRREA